MPHCPWIIAIMSCFNDRVKNLSKHLQSQENLDRVCSITEMYPHSSSRQKFLSAVTTDRERTTRLEFGVCWQPEHTPRAPQPLASLVLGHAGVA